MTAKKKLALLLAAVLLIALILPGCGRRGESTEKTTSRGGKITADAGSNNKPASERVIGRGNSVAKEMSSEEVAEYLQTRVVKIETQDSVGSGFFIDDEGTLVTNYHVIEGAETLDVIMSDGGRYEVTTIVDFCPYRDLAVLKIDLSGNDYLTFADEVRQGSAVYVMGSPKNMEASFTSGTVSSTSRKAGLMDCIQIDAAVNPGNSGGPAVNSRGEVLGVNTWIRSDAQNMAFAVKISMLEDLDMDKNYTVNRYREWYNKETGRSYMAYEETETQYLFEYTYIHTYTTVTGVECLGSTDDFEDFEDGYSIMYLYYIYDYDAENYDKFCDYLNSIGFEYAESSREMGLEGVVYVHPFEGYYMELLIDTADNLLVIGSPTW